MIRPALYLTRSDGPPAPVQTRLKGPPAADQKGPYMKRRTTRLPALLCILLITITGMFLVSCDSGNERTPTQAAKTTLDALKDQNLNVLKTTYAGDASDFSLNTDQLLGRTYKLNKHEKKTVNKLIRKLLEFDYTLGDENVRGSSATIDVTFKTYNFREFVKDMEQATVTASKKEINTSKMTDKEIEKKTISILFDQLDRHLDQLQVRDLENIVTMKLEKKDGKWLVSEQSKQFYDAMFGNLYTALSSIQTTS